jgi:hypothetical protein
MISLKGQFTRIKGSFSESRQLPRLGKIRLGIKKKSVKGVDYPSETPWFVVPPEVEAVYGSEPLELDIMLPVEDPEVFFPQKLAMYGSGTGLKCHGNGEQAKRLTEQNEWVERTCPCEHLKSDANPKGACTEQSSLMVLLPMVSMGGCYQITTGSFHSTRTLNSALDYIRALVGRLALIPMKLRRVPRETHNDGKKQTHYTMELILDGDLKMIRDLRADIEGVLIPGRYQIEGPLDENKTLDAADITEMDAEDLADMDDQQLAEVQAKLKAQREPQRTEPQKAQPAAAPVAAMSPPAKTNGNHSAMIPASQWQEIITYIDTHPDLATLKHDWKVETKVDNVIRLTVGGQQAFLAFMRERVGAEFPY